MSKHLRVLLIALAALLATTDAWPCSWEERSFHEQLHSADVLLVVRAVSIRNRTSQAVLSRIAAGEVNVDIPEDEYGLAIDFELLHTIKGDPSQIKVLTTGYDDADCGLPIRVGEVWLVDVFGNGGVGLGGASMKIGTSGLDDAALKTIRDIEAVVNVPAPATEPEPATLATGELESSGNVYDSVAQLRLIGKIDAPHNEMNLSIRCPLNEPVVGRCLNPLHSQQLTSGPLRIETKELWFSPSASELHLPVRYMVQITAADCVPIERTVDLNKLPVEDGMPTFHIGDVRLSCKQPNR